MSEPEWDPLAFTQGMEDGAQGKEISDDDSEDASYASGYVLGNLSSKSVAATRELAGYLAQAYLWVIRHFFLLILIFLVLALFGYLAYLSEGYLGFNFSTAGSIVALVVATATIAGVWNGFLYLRGYDYARTMLTGASSPLHLILKTSTVCSSGLAAYIGAYAAGSLLFYPKVLPKLILEAVAVAAAMVYSYNRHWKHTRVLALLAGSFCFRKGVGEFMKRHGGLFSSLDYLPERNWSRATDRALLICTLFAAGLVTAGTFLLDSWTHYNEAPEPYDPHKPRVKVIDEILSVYSEPSYPADNRKSVFLGDTKYRAPYDSFQQDCVPGKVKNGFFYVRFRHPHWYHFRDSSFKDVYQGGWIRQQQLRTDVVDMEGFRRFIH